MRVMKSLRYHRGQISRNVRQVKKVDKTIQKYLSKSKQVLVKYEGLISENYLLFFKNKMVEMKALWRK